MNNVENSRETYGIIADYCERCIESKKTSIKYTEKKFAEDIEKTHNYEEKEKIKKEFDDRIKRYKSEISEIESLRLAAHSLLIRIEGKEQEKEKYAESFRVVDDIRRSFFENAKETFDKKEQGSYEKDAKHVAHAARDDRISLSDELASDMKYTISSFEEKCKKFGLNRKIFQGNHQYTLGGLCERLVGDAKSTYISTYSPDHREYEAKATEESQRKMGVIEQYEKNYEIERVMVENKKPVFRAAKGHNPVHYAVTGKHSLEKMMEAEKVLDKVRHAYHTIDGQKLPKTRDTLIKLEQKYMEILAKHTEEFNKSDYLAIEEAVKRYNERVELERSIDAYAHTYAELLEAQRKGDREEIARLENALYTFKLNDSDIMLAKIRGESIVHEKRMRIVWKQNERIAQQLMEEAKYRAESELTAKLRAEITHDLAWSNWEPKNYTPIIKGGDLAMESVVEYEKLFQEEVERRLQERLGIERYRQEKEESERAQAQMQSESVAPVEDDTELRTAVEEMLKNTSRHVTPAQVEEYVSKYKGMSHLTSRERAIQILIFEGYIKETIDLENPPKYVRDAIAAQMRIDSEISEIIDRPKLEEFERAKARLEAARKYERSAGEEELDMPVGGPKR